MFQLWNLVFLCHLLTGTLAQLLNLGNVLPGGDSLSGLSSAGDTLQDPLQKIDLGVLKDSSVVQQALKNQASGNLLSDLFSQVLPRNILGVDISKIVIMDVKAEPKADGANLRFPITANITATLPLLGQVVGTSVSLDLLTGVKLETDPQTKLPTLVVGDCAVDPTKITLSLFDRRSALVNRIFDAVTSTLSTIVSSLVQYQLNFYQVVCKFPHKVNGQGQPL